MISRSPTHAHAHTDAKQICHKILAEPHSSFRRLRVVKIWVSQMILIIRSSCVRGVRGERANIATKEDVFWKDIWFNRHWLVHDGNLKYLVKNIVLLESQ